MCVNVIKVGPATYFFAINISQFQPCLKSDFVHIMEVYQSLEAYNNKKHGIWITKKMIWESQSNKYSDWMII